MVPKGDIIERLQDLLLPVLQDYGLELVEIEFKPSGKRWLLRVYIDKEGGVTISDCETVSREFSRILDIEDIIDHPYSLEVSSPGLTRPLNRRQDFVRNKGKMCRIVTKEPIRGRNEFKGVITDVREEDVEIRSAGDVLAIPVSTIKKANLEFEL